MSSISAAELKTGGVTAIERAMVDHEPLFISVRGVKKFVVLDIESFNTLQELELDNAIREAEADYEKGNYTVENNIDEYARKLMEELDLSSPLFLPIPSPLCGYFSASILNAFCITNRAIMRF